MMNIVRSTALAAFGLIVLAAAPIAAQETWQWNGQLAAGKVIEVKGINGGIRAVPSNGNDIRVSATKKAKRSDPDDVRFEVLEHADGVTICAMYPARRGTNECRPGAGGRMNVENNDVEVEWVVQVPRGIDFAGRTVNGGVEIAGTPANATAVTVNGAVRISTAGFARANTVNGDVEVSMGRSDWQGAMKFETINGDVSISVPGNLNTDLSASTVNGDMETDFPLEIRGRFGPKRISGTIGSGGRSLTLSTVNGDIRIRRR